MIKTTLMTRFIYTCDVWNCNRAFGTFKKEWAERRGWKESTCELKNEGLWDGVHHLTFCPSHTLKDWL